jgi:RNA polymerase subunit RPABC4/transcription elongation factor Spt4
MGITIKCSNCHTVMEFVIYYSNAKQCPYCNKKWDYSKISSTKLRRKDK